MNVTKNTFFFLSRALTHYNFTLNSRALYELKRKVCPSKSVCGIFHFWFRLSFIKAYIFVQQKEWTLTLKGTHTFALIFKLQKEVLKFNTCVSWSSQKADPDTNFLNFENWRFEYKVFLNSNFFKK